jgi:hypothetical protein
MPGEPLADPEVLNYLKSTKTLLLEAPLYLKFDLSRRISGQGRIAMFDQVGKSIFDLLLSTNNIDAYCVYCNRDSVFSHRLPIELQQLPGDPTRMSGGGSKVASTSISFLVPEPNTTNMKSIF